MTLVITMLVSFAAATTARAETVYVKNGKQDISYLPYGEDVVLVLSGDFTLNLDEDAELMAIDCRGYSLTVIGDSILTIMNYDGPAIAGGTSSKVTIDGGTIIAESDTSDYEEYDSAGIGVGSFTVNGGEVMAASADGSGIEAKTLTIKGGTLDAESYVEGSPAIYIVGDVNIESGTIKAKADDANAVYCDGSIYISGGTVNVENSSSDGTLSAYTKVEIYGGNVKAINGANDEGTGIYSDGSIIISGGYVESEAGWTGIAAINAIKISGGKITTPSSYEISKDGEVYAVYDIKGDPATMVIYQSDEDSDDDEDGDGDENDHHSYGSSSKLIINPDALTVTFLRSGVYVPIAAGKQAQGPLGQMIFNKSMPIGWTEAFSFNITVDSNADYTFKNGILTLYIPAQYQKAGRQFAIMGIDQSGKVETFPDTDTSEATVTVNLSLSGYALDLVYKD